MFRWIKTDNFRSSSSNCTSCSNKWSSLFTSKLGRCPFCFKLSFSGALVGWILFLIVSSLDLSIIVRLAVLLPSASFSLLWLLHLSSVVKDVVMSSKRRPKIAKSVRGAESSLTRRSLLAASLSGLVGAFLVSIPFTKHAHAFQPCTFSNTDRVYTADVSLSDGGSQTSQLHGDIALNEDGQLERLNLIATSVGSSADDETGIITLSWNPENGSTGRADPESGEVLIDFVVDVTYPKIADDFGFIKDFDSYTTESEKFTAWLKGEFTSPTSLRVMLELNIVSRLSNIFFKFLANGIELVCNPPAGGGGCPAEKQCKKKTLCLQPVVIAMADGSNPTSCPSFEKTKEIWGKCCKEITIKPVKTIKNADFMKIAAGANSLTSEEQELIKLETDDSDAAPNNTCVEVYCVERFQDEDTGIDDEDINGGAYTVSSGTAAAKIVVQSDTDPANVAHEVGHALGLQHPAADDGTVMHPSGKNKIAVSENQSKSNCNNGMKGNCKTKKPEEECCKTWELDK